MFFYSYNYSLTESKSGHFCVHFLGYSSKIGVFWYNQAMKIGIDARMYGPYVGGGGLGRYVEQLILALQKHDPTNRYVLFLKKENFDACHITNPHFEKRLAPIHWYTLAEQLKMGGLMDRERCDLLHFPHWNVPYPIKTPYVVTIHDLLLLDEPKSARATTRHPLVYAIKYLGYKSVLAQALKKARHIIAVSHHTQESIRKHFPNIPQEKMSVVYEGVTELKTPPSPPLLRGGTAQLLYVGNAYPHKNLETLLVAFVILQKTHPKVHLTLAGRSDVFYDRLQKKWATFPGVSFVMNPTDEIVAHLYASATVFVLPSRQEGFGLTALEAMNAGLPVIAARAGSLPEILKNAAVFMDPNDPQNMASIIANLLDDASARATLVARGYEQIKNYSWERMGQEIMEVYAKAS